MKTKLLYAKTAMFALACFSSVGVWGQTKITDENGLKAIAENLAGDYVLENNITLSGEWEPIGTNDAPFTGTIDGKGHTIYGLKINLPEQNSVGFIGAAKIEEVSSTKTTVKNLRLVGVEITGRQDVGAVIGNSYGARVSECYTSGLVYGWDHTGGIIGGTKKVSDDIMTEVSNCYSNAAVISSSYQAGGIIGASNNAVVDHCYFAGVATCPQGRSGGIVALNDGNSLTIANCVVLSSYIKAGSGDAGGANAILGADNPAEDSNAVSTISQSYSWSGLKLYENNVEKARTNNANDSYDGGYIELNELKTAQFWLTEAAFDAGIWIVNENAYPSLPNIQTPLENGLYIPSFPERCLPGKTFNATAVSASGRTITYTSSDPVVATIDDSGLVKFLKDGKTTLTFSDQGDDYVKGVERTYELEVKGVAYTIMNEEDLRCMKYDLAGDFKLGADIYLTKDWELMDVFTGTLDGQGYAIHGLRFVNEDQGRVGLFGEATGATIKRVGIVGAYLNGNEDVGTIVGYASGCNISECYVDQSSYIAGRDHIGSIVGKVEKREIEQEGSTEKISIGTVVSDCYSMAKIYSREYQAGGVIGVINHGTVERCYFSGNVRAMKGRAGGIFSMVDADGAVFVKNNVCLASGIFCSEATYCIGENGRISTATLSDNYVDYYASYRGADLSSSAPADSYDSAGNDGETLSADEVLSSEFYMSDAMKWDFENVWTFIEGGDGNMYPILKCQQSKEITPVIYGIPEPAFLIQKSDLTSLENINIERIKSTCGQKLNFEVTEGKKYVYIDGPYLDLTGEIIEGESSATVSITPEVEIAGVKTSETNSFDIKLMGQSYVFEINTVQDLLDVNDKLFANFRLMSDIDMTGVEFRGIGSLEAPFVGTFDGNGFSILNPVVITNNDNTKGFFNATEGAKIMKLGIVNFSFSGSQTSGNKSTDLGGFAGSAKETTFDQCYLTGKVVGRDHVGGFIGGNCANVTITDSYVDVEVLAYSQAGGFFGVASGNVTMKNCYFAGSVKLDPARNYGWVGGFVGLVDADNITVTIENCVSIGDLRGNAAAGSFIGANGGDQENNPRAIINFTGNIYHSEAEKMLMDEGKYSENDWETKKFPTKEGGIVVKPTERYSNDLGKNQFYTQALYEAASFDFDNIWFIEEGVGYPTLKNVPEKGPGVGIVQVIDKEKSYVVSVFDNAITISGIEDAAKVTLYNMNGQVISQGATTGENVQLYTTGKGFYIVRIIENSSVTSIKLVVE